MSTRTIQAFKRAAMQHPDVEEGIACKGTVLESSAFKARKKTFLFLRSTQARLKLRESLPEATLLASKEPALYSVGSLGWVLVKLDADTAVPPERIKEWVGESYRVVVGEPAAPPAKRGKRPAKAGGAKKRAASR